MAFKPNEITAEHVREAVAKIEREHLILNLSTRWLVEIEGKQYPPKEIMRLAHEQMNGERIWEYGGGDATNKYLQKFNYTILEKEIHNESEMNFKELIEKVKSSIEQDPQMKDLFVFNKTKTNYVWISDKYNIIGDTEAHFEIITLSKEKCTVDIHFEGLNKNKFVSIIENLQAPLKSITWQKAKSIRYNDSINMNDPDAAERIIQHLLYLENHVGDEIRTLMNSASFNMTTDIIFPLNQILFGPPGTGKTYNTINKAMMIVEGLTEEELIEKYATRKAIKKAFDDLIITDFENSTGQIAFCTFHQSTSYEDFIEGIKPDKTDEGEVFYEIKKGVFRLISELASAEVIKTSNFDEVYQKLLNDIEHSPDNRITLETTIQAKEFSIYKNSKGNLRFHANTDKAYEGVIKKNVIEHYLITGEALDWSSYTKAVGKYIKDKYGYSQDVEKRDKKYVLIIDEINRGNVSQIFGELITLIEDDKRIGKEEAIEAILPYSKVKFSVPSNLYIIGTMNTADRSVEALDAALRRRFSFEEMPPRPQLVSPQRKLWDLWWKYEGIDWYDEPYVTKERELVELLGIEEDFDPKGGIWERMKNEGQRESQVSYLDHLNYSGINPEKLLTTINRRIEKLLDKDHQIGHSYFMSVNSVSQLKLAFHNKIIPLLQEYFFGDYSKIGLVLGAGFVEMEESGNIFADFDDDLAAELSERLLYKIKNVANMGAVEFKSAINTMMG
jgi:5-methylcytosine-specific restriction endonuclease McrBC GTP-binding regulatory subunit McrB/predicted acetyltransferase